jgi:hypothetical protein
MPTTVELTPDEIAERGQAIYEEHIRTQVETENIGKMLLIDITTGRWEMGDDRIPLSRSLRAQNPNAVIYGLRVGFPTAEKIGAWPRSRSTRRSTE